MRVTVFAGGPSSEREISLRSGQCIADGLVKMGHDVFVSDISPTYLTGLDHPCDVVFPALHGEFGESGELQELLEARNIPFVGSGSVASRLGMDKQEAKQIWNANGLLTPESIVVDQMPVISLPAWPCVVKPIDGGSSIDTFVFKKIPTLAEYGNAVQSIVSKGKRALVERFIEGTEITVGILGNRALPPIRIGATDDFFDFDAKYSANGAKHHFDLNLPEEIVQKTTADSLRAFDLLGCRDLARTDVIVDSNGHGYLLEINTMPGFTNVSLLPDAASKIGISFPQLVDNLVKLAYARGAS